jgi:hypothetical protein
MEKERKNGKRVYVAGPYSDSNGISVLNNMREGMRLSTQVLLLGYFPFCPFIDYHFQLMLRPDEKLTIDDYYAYSMAWLEVSDAVLLVPGWEKSIGAQKEVKRATELYIPIFYDLMELRTNL